MIQKITLNNSKIINEKENYKIQDLSFSGLKFGISITLLISIFLKMDSIVRLGDTLYNQQVDSIILFTFVFIFRFVMGFVAVILIIPAIINDSEIYPELKRWVSPNRNSVLLGCLSGLLFIVLALIISIILEIFQPDFPVLFDKPNVYSEPDTVGWYYFLFALIPAIWEEVAFRGILCQKLRIKYSKNYTILISSSFFSLFHLTNIIVMPVGTVIGGMIMSFFYGLIWGSLVLRTDSLVPSMISHYLIDTFGLVFLIVRDTDPIQVSKFMILLTFMYPILHYRIFRFLTNSHSRT